MKTLYLLRHAKSSWDDPDLPDHDRPLNERGERDASRMGVRLAQRSDPPEVVVSSSAVRARATAEIVARELGFAPTEVEIEPRLYGAGVGGLIEVIQGLDDGLDRAMVVGHNPTITDLANLLGGVEIDNVPTCGLVVLGCRVASWQEVERGAADILDFDYPRRWKGS